MKPLILVAAAAAFAAASVAYAAGGTPDADAQARPRPTRPPACPISARSTGRAPKSRRKSTSPTSAARRASTKEQERHRSHRVPRSRQAGRDRREVELRHALPDGFDARHVAEAARRGHPDHAPAVAEPALLIPRRAAPNAARHLPSPDVATHAARVPTPDLTHPAWPFSLLFPTPISRNGCATTNWATCLRSAAFRPVSKTAISS